MLTLIFLPQGIKKSMRKILASLFLFATFLLSATIADAAGNVVCQPIYGGGQTCIVLGQLAINKFVQNPQTGQFVDNLSVNDQKHGPNQIVTFRIDVVNSGGTTLGKIIVKDVFPNFVNFKSGAGNFDPNNKTLTFEVTNLLPNETRTFTIQGTVVGNIPQGTTCVINQATATVDSKMAADNAQLCLETAVTKGGLPVFPPPKVVVTPPTGPELLPLISLLPAGIGGWFLRKHE